MGASQASCRGFKSHRPLQTKLARPGTFKIAPGDGIEPTSELYFLRTHDRGGVEGGGSRVRPSKELAALGRFAIAGDQAG